LNVSEGEVLGPGYGFGAGGGVNCGYAVREKWSEELLVMLFEVVVVRMGL
jgi:hypothetical protein